MAPGTAPTGPEGGRGLVEQSTPQPLTGSHAEGMDVCDITTIPAAAQQAAVVGIAAANCKAHMGIHVSLRTCLV